MRDSEVVASIVAGDPEGLARAYDRYADPLYKYCRSMLGDPAGAADAVQDTFVIAAFRLDGLRDTERLRAWLYAVARNEYLRILRTGKSPAALTQARDMTDEGVRASEDDADLRILLEEASRGLNPDEREAIELQLRQGLEPAEIATVLGVPGNQVHAMLSRARDQLQACLSALLVGRGGRGDCDELASMLSGWDGRLTPLLRKRVSRHIERCPECTARRAYELRPAVLLGLSPGAAIIAAASESLRLAPGPPAALKAHTLAVAAGRSTGAIAHRAAVLSEAGSFGRHGFPKPLQAPPRGPWRGPLVTAAAVVVAVAIASVAFSLTQGGGHGPVAGGNPTLPASAARATDAAAPAPSSATATRHASSPTAKPSTTTSPSPTPTTSSPAPSRSPTPAPTPSSSTGRPTPSPSPTRSAPSGTLVVSPAGGSLTVQPDGAKITLTARGGPVNWSIAVSAGPGHVSVQPSSGTLQATGGPMTVTITASRSTSGRRLMVSPGGEVLTIVSGQNAKLAIVSPLAGAAGALRVALLSLRIVF